MIFLIFGMNTKKVVPRGYVRILGKIAELSDAGKAGPLQEVQKKNFMVRTKNF